MTKRHYKEGIDRQQGFLLPLSVEEYVAEDNPVRAIDAYVDSLDLERLGFKHTAGKLTPGQPAYDPKGLLKLYLYGYLHRIRSSRRLEAECQRNLEVIWLLQGLRPGYKTIADFRKENLGALKAVNRDFVQVCKELDLFGAELVSIDGSFFRGNVNKDHIYTEKRLKKSLERIEKHIGEYLQALEQTDQAEEGQTNEPSGLAQKLAKLKERQKQHQVRLEKLRTSGQKQLAEVDEDARLLYKGGQSVAGYNVQAAVDEKHKLIVVHEVTQDGNDENQLEPMAKAAKAELAVDQLQAAADGGYFNAQQIKNCQEAQITVYVPEPDKSNQPRLAGRFGREAFAYDAQTNRYVCPAGKQLAFSCKQQKGGKTLWVYRSSVGDCRACALQQNCLAKKSSRRSVTRWEHEEVIEAHRERMIAKGGELMQKRACLAEHPFGTLKMWCGWTHFLLRGLEKVRAEMSLLVLAYNFRRVLTILDWQLFRDYCQQRSQKVALGW